MARISGDINIFGKTARVKTLILIRHAESGWQTRGTDKDRILTDKGTRDAAFMAQRLASKNLQPEMFISSPANRAVQTLQYFIKELADGEQAVIEEKLYPGNVRDYQILAEAIPDGIHSALIVGHNPAISEYIREMLQNHYIKMLPGSICAIALHADHWSEISYADKELLFMESP